MATLFRSLGAVAMVVVWSVAWADDVPTSSTGDQSASVTPKPSRLSPKDIPQSVPNADKRIEESMSISTELLHGFSRKAIEQEAAERLAMLIGASESSTGSHPSEGGFGDYVIGAGDVVEFISFDDVTLNRTVTVRYDGYISLPRVNDIKIAGLTRPAAENEVKRVYGQIYREPELSLAIVNPDSKAYVVTGDVQLPGRYAYSRQTSLWDAISLAGGLRQRGNDSGSGFVAITGQITKAFVIRRIDGERQVHPYDLRGFGKPGAYAGDAPIYYGDIVYVPEGMNLVYLLGESQAPVIVELTEGMSLLQMLALSGGFNSSTARLKEVILLREVDENTTDIHRIDVREILKNKTPDMQLQPGDIIYIPRKYMVRLSEFVLNFTNSISPLLGMYTTAVEAVFALPLNRETLDALENQNEVVIGTGAAVAATPAVTRVPRVIAPQNIAPTNLNP